MTETTEAETAPRETPALPTEDRARRRNGVGFFTVLLTSIIVAALLGAVFAVWPVWLPHVRPLTDALHAHVPSLFQDNDAERQIAILNERLAALEKARMPTATTAAPDEQGEDPAAVIARIEALEEALSRLDASPGERQQGESASPPEGRTTKDLEDGGASASPSPDVNAEALAATKRFFKQDEALRATLQDMAKRLSVLEASGPVARRDVGLRDPAGLLTLGQLREALRGSTPFVIHLAALTDMVGQDPALTPALATLRRHAETGVPTLENLRVAFSEIAFDVVNAAGSTAEDGWMAQTANRILSVVRVRRLTDDPQDDGVDAIVARMEASLTDGDLAKAVGYGETLAGGPAAAISPWLTQAQSRLQTEAALDHLQAYAVSPAPDGN